MLSVIILCVWYIGVRSCKKLHLDPEGFINYRHHDSYTINFNMSYFYKTQFSKNKDICRDLISKYTSNQDCEDYNN